MTCDMWHMACYTWHEKHDFWHMTCDMWLMVGGVNILWKYHLPSTYGLEKAVFWRLRQKERLTAMTELMNYKGVCPGSLGLLIQYDFKQILEQLKL